MGVGCHSGTAATCGQKPGPPSCPMSQQPLHGCADQALPQSWRAPGHSCGPVESAAELGPSRSVVQTGPLWGGSTELGWVEPLPPPPEKWGER